MIADVSVALEFWEHCQEHQHGRCNTSLAVLCYTATPLLLCCLLQVMAQPVLAALDRAAIYVLPGSMTHPIWRRAAMRLPFVGLCAIIAAIMPFFTVFVGLIGAVVFWLPAVHMPIALHQKMFPPTKFQRIWMGVIDAIAFVVCALAIVASVRGMIVGLEHAKFFD